MAELEGPKKFMPTLRLNAVEGDFGGGPGVEHGLGQSLRHRPDGEVEPDGVRHRPAETAAGAEQAAQAHLSFDDLQAKLTLGVQEARSAILSGQEQIIASGDMVKHASETYRLSNLRSDRGRAGQRSRRGGAGDSRPGIGPHQLLASDPRLQQGADSADAAAGSVGVRIGREA